MKIIALWITSVKAGENENELRAVTWASHSELQTDGGQSRDPWTPRSSWCSNMGGWFVCIPHESPSNKQHKRLRPYAGDHHLWSQSWEMSRKWKQSESVMLKNRLRLESVLFLLVLQQHRCVTCSTRCFSPRLRHGTFMIEWFSSTCPRLWQGVWFFHDVCDYWELNHGSPSATSWFRTAVFSAIRLGWPILSNF